MKTIIARSFIAICMFAVIGCDMPPDSALKIGNDDIDDFDNGGDKESDTEAPESDSETGNVDTDGTDSETETATELDTDTETATDTSILEDCIYDCTTGAECQNQNGTIHDEMLCDDRLVCCETGVYKAMWTCMICNK